MNVESNDKEAEVASQIAAVAKDAFAKHVVTVIGPGEWSCQRPGTGVYQFTLIARPGTLMVYGDIGEWILRMHDADPVRWARSAVRSPDYLFEKLRAWPDHRQTFYVQDALAWLRESADAEEHEEGDQAPSRCERALAELDDDDELTHEKFCEVLREYDFDDVWTIGVRPSTSCFWLREALSWFVDHALAVTAPTHEAGGAP